ncbi:hypothetical protein YC2023_057561 [Brassica napus]
MTGIIGKHLSTGSGLVVPSCKPAADFGIQDLWPNYNDGSHPSNCNPDSEFDRSKISDIVSLQTKWLTLSCPSNDGFKFWKHEWKNTARVPSPQWIYMTTLRILFNLEIRPILFTSSQTLESYQTTDYMIFERLKMPLGLLQASNVTKIRSLTIKFTRSAFASYIRN